MKVSKMIALLCFLSIISCKENKSEAQSTSVTTVVNELIVAAEFKTKVENKKVQLIDVRTPKEYNEGHIKDAENIDFYDPTFYNQMNNLNKDEPIYIYCRSGGRSGNAAAQLKEQGFKEVYDLKGGILNWKKQNLELVK
jgi:rhodanese-related sulfurtransferase